MKWMAMILFFEALPVAISTLAFTTLGMRPFIYMEKSRYRYFVFQFVVGNIFWIVSAGHLLMKTLNGKLWFLAGQGIFLVATVVVYYSSPLPKLMQGFGGVA
jgi:hypothetical protein